MRWFVFSSESQPAVRSKKIGTAARLTLESLEERQCLAADVGFAASNFSQLSVTENDLSQLESAEQATSNSGETTSLQTERCINVNGETDDAEDPPEDAPGCIVVPPDNLKEEAPVDTVSTTERTSEDDSLNALDDPQTDGFSGRWTFAGPADLALASQELGASGFESTAPQETLPSPVPAIEPNRAIADSRPLIQPVESLQVTLIVPINAAERNTQFTAPALSVGDSNARIGMHDLGAEGRKLAASFTSEAPKTVTNALIPKTEYESERPIIASVTALMPALEPRKSTQTAAEVNREPSALGRLIRSSNSQDIAMFVPIEEEVRTTDTTDTGAITPELLGESDEEEPAESINPLCFVVLVGLIGIPKLDRFRLIRKTGMRDNSPAPRPITVVPLVNELEQWPKTTLVKRKQDETI